MDKMINLDQTKCHPMVGVPLETLKPKKVRKEINLTLWEKLYIFEILRGMSITSKHFASNMIGFVFPPKGKKRSVFTVYYPEEKVTLPPAYRGRPVLVMRKDGTEKCVACGLCEKICPASAISIVAGEKDNADRYPVKYSLDMSRCVYCGYCEEVCPKEAIVMSSEYEGLAQRDRSKLLYSKEDLLRSEENVKERIEYIRRIYSKCNY
ncbi:MAG TPA: NADH-quinone oxidoreductase subunit I [Anaerolineales bacterium]|nr:NADH-quinone oxidoreductase subunit I [Anaerolineales bacterium]